MILDSSGKPIAGAEQGTSQPRREVVRSVSFKLNLGNYQSMDFFCSQKAECGADEVDAVAVDLSEWCYDKVMESAKEVQRKQAAKIAAQSARSNAA